MNPKFESSLTPPLKRMIALCAVAVALAACSRDLSAQSTRAAPPTAAAPAGAAAEGPASAPAAAQTSGFASAPDRKSTRLNSSHLVISYAVFCLTKKKGHIIGGTVSMTTDPLAFTMLSWLLGSALNRRRERKIAYLTGSETRGSSKRTS